jgi:hypothetical protein
MPRVGRDKIFRRRLAWRWFRSVGAPQSARGQLLGPRASLIDHCLPVYTRHHQHVRRWHY